MAFTLLTACKDKKEVGAGKTNTSSADDYRSGEDKTEKNEKTVPENKNQNNTDFSGGEDKKDENTNLKAAGWPESEKESFMKSCVAEAMKNNNNRSVSSRYCQCMLEKMESLYPDINKAARLTESEIERVMLKYKDGCLEQ
jgi:type III secretory pathway component EscV